QHFTLKAKTDIMAGTISMLRVNIELDGNSAEGGLTYATDGRRTLQGTLALAALHLTPYLSTIPLIAANPRDWDRMPVALDGFTNFDLDLRLSAGRVAIGSVRLNRTALATNLRGGQLVLTIGESEAFGGDIKGSFTIAKSEGGVDVKS